MAISFQIWNAVSIDGNSKWRYLDMFDDTVCQSEFLDGGFGEAPELQPGVPFATGVFDSAAEFGFLVGDADQGWTGGGGPLVHDQFHGGEAAAARFVEAVAHADEYGAEAFQKLLGAGGPGGEALDDLTAHQRRVGMGW